MNRRLSIAFLCSMAGLISTEAHAGLVHVWGNRFNLNHINDFYSSQPGVQSKIIGNNLNTNDLSNVDLLWIVQPARSLKPGEIHALDTYLSAGGRIVFLGEHGYFAPNENARISQAIGELGGNMSITRGAVDGGYHLTHAGQILSHPLNQDVAAFEYAAFAPIKLGGNAEAVMTGKNASDVMIGYESVGGGSIVLLTDQNVWNRIGSSRNNNVQFMRNLLTIQSSPPPQDQFGGVPEPASVVCWLAVVCLGAAFARSRRAHRLGHC